MTNLKINEPVIGKFMSKVFEYSSGGTLSLLGIGEKGTPQEGKYRKRVFLSQSEGAEVFAHVNRWAEMGVAAFFVPATIKDSAVIAGDVTADKIAGFTSIVLDLDSGDIDAKVAYVSSTLGTPSMVVASGGKTEEGQAKRHLWFMLNEESADVERVASLRKVLAAKVGGDQSFGRATQVIRIAGSVHAKNGISSAVELLECNDNEYSLDDLAETIEAMQIMPGLPVPATSPLALVAGGMMDFSPKLNSSAFDRVTHEGGIDGQTRHDALSEGIGTILFRLRQGGITENEALELSHEFNRLRISEPWKASKVDADFHGLLRLERINYPPQPSTTAEGAFQPLDLWPVQNTPVMPPEFPVSVLGSAWADWVGGTSHSAGAPIAYVGISLLVSAAALIGNARRVVHGAWAEPAILWALMIGNPSSGKTPALRPVQTILGKFDRDISAGYPTAKSVHQAKESSAKIAKEEWEKATKKALSNNQPAPPMPAAANAPDAPICPALVVNDVTPEKLGYLSNASPKGLIMVRDEAAGWLGNMNRYSGGGERQKWLEAYNGDAAKIDRVKHDGSIHIEHFSVSVLGGIQPDRFNLLLRDDPDDGLIPRFLFAYPDPVPPTRAATWTPDLDPIVTMRALFNLRLAKIDETLQPQELPLSADGADRFEQWRQLHYSESLALEGMAVGAWGKMPGQLLRIALVLEFLHWSGHQDRLEPTAVTADSIESAIVLIEQFFKPMARRALGAADGSPKIYAAKLLAKHIVANRITVVDTRPLMDRKGCPTLLRKPEQMDPACVELVDAGWLRPVNTRAGGAKGKLPKAFDVSPDLWRALGENLQINADR